jgi:hypothetical protein
MIGVILIICFIILLSYLIDYDSIEGRKYIIQLDRSNFDLMEQKSPFEDKKNLFILSIGSNNDFLKRTTLKNSYDPDKISENDEEIEEESKLAEEQTTIKNETATALCNYNQMDANIDSIDENRVRALNKLVNFKQFIESAPDKI